jgi:hypothetical protein
MGRLDAQEVSSLTTVCSSALLPNSGPGCRIPADFRAAVFFGPAKRLPTPDLFRSERLSFPILHDI